MIKPGQKLRIKNIDRVIFPEGASENKKDRFRLAWFAYSWTLFADMGEVNYCIVNEEGLYVSIPKEDVHPLKKIYLCGPITGVVNKNVEAFTHYRDLMIKAGYEVINPHELNHSEHADSWEEYMKVDFLEMIKCDFLGLMFSQFWKNSKGCMAELFMADTLKIPIIDMDTMQELKFEFILEFVYKKSMQKASV